MTAKVLAFAITAVERIEPSAPPGALMVGSVCILGLGELEPAVSPPSFTDRWRNAMCHCIGAEEFEKYCREAARRIPGN